MDKTVVMKCEGALRIPLEELLDLQGGLKELSPENKLKLRTEILNTGFAFAPHVWVDADDKKYLVDGHQRTSILRDLKAEGYEVPPVPVSTVEAPTMAEAKRRILQASSQYGEMTAQGLYDFMLINEIPFQDVQASFDLPNIDMTKFKDFFAMPETKPEAASVSSEIGEEQFSHLQHTCPQCGHQFGKGG